MHVVLEADHHNAADFPAWCGLSWFHDCVCDGDVEPHYHDLAEIWLWHDGSAEATVQGRALAMRPGALLYTPPACLHSYRQTTPHRNTGITPRGVGRPGHLHLEETGEVLEPTMAPFWFLHAENHPARPAILPAEAFLRSAYCGRFRPGQEVWQGSHDGWWALLVREGEVDGEVGTAGFALVQGQLLVASAGETAALRAASDCECAFALGWPQG